MGFLYLFNLANPLNKSEQQRVAILSKNDRKGLERHKDGEVSNAFERFGLRNSFIISKSKLMIDENVFDDITSKVFNKDKLKILNNGGDYYLCINDVKYLLKSLSYKNAALIEYKIVIIFINGNKD